MLKESTVELERIPYGDHEAAVPCLEENNLALHLSGQCRLEWSSGNESFTYRPFRGAITLIPVGRSGQLRVSGVCEIAKIRIPQAVLCSFAEIESQGRSNASELLARQGINDPLLIQLCFALLNFATTGHTDQVYRDCLMNTLVAHLVRGYSASPNGSTRSTRDYRLSEPRSRRAVEFMQEHLADSFRLEDVARDLGLSTSHFAAQFRSKFGQSPARYLRWLRLEQACTLLKTTPRSVADIAATVGFISPSHFTQAFRSAYNIGPTAFRAQFGQA